MLTPALTEVNDYGTVIVTMTTRKKGKSIDTVRFDWSWKSLAEARVTDEENDRHAAARHKSSDGSAPPLTNEPEQTLESAISALFGSFQNTKSSSE